MRQFLLQMAGWPGSGKSTLAREVRARTGAVLIDKDDLMAAAMRAGLEPAQCGGLAYETGFELMRSLLAQGHRVILDSPANFERIRVMGACIAREADVPYYIIECVVPEMRLLEARLRERQPVHVLHPASLEGQDLAYARAGTSPLNEPHLSIDTSLPLEDCLREALEYIGCDAG